MRLMRRVDHRLRIFRDANLRNAPRAARNVSVPEYNRPIKRNTMAAKRFPSGTQAPRDPGQSGERRRLSRIVHDHKGNAIVEWLDAPEDTERQVLEIEGATRPATPGKA